MKVGDRVTRGQVLGRLGNSGNSSEVHLHFQLQRSPALLTGDNVPFEIDTLTYQGSVAENNVFSAGPAAITRTGQLPLLRSVVSFPAGP